MTLVWQLARIGAIGAILTAMFLLLPAATVVETVDATPLEIPAVVWDPLVAVLHLNRYLPISALLIVAGLSLAVTAGMATLGLASWILKHVFP